MEPARFLSHLAEGTTLHFAQRFMLYTQHTQQQQQQAAAYKNNTIIIIQYKYI